MTEETTIENPSPRDAMLEKLEQMLESMPEDARQPIRDLINKRKVELGLMKSELPSAGYRLRKTEKKVPPRKPSKETVKSLNKIARSVGKVREPGDEVSKDIDIKDEPLKKERKITEESDSYKY
jgi:hypothetical protein